MVEHPQVLPPQPVDVPALQMQETDDVGHDFVIAAHVAGRADELHVAADAGEILPEVRASMPMVGFLLLSSVL